MSLLKPAVLEQAYGKVGILGFAGSGKSFTAMKIAVGICEIEKRTKAAFFDTETGSDFLLGKFNEAGIELLSVKSRSFDDLVGTIKECEQSGVFVLIIDSITHVWRDLCESYDKKLKRNGRLQFQDWAVIKKVWHEYTDLYINSKVHIIVCGRAGFEYDYTFDERGNKDLIKTGIKMKVETEFGFEPSLVLDMERISKNKEEATSLKTKTARQSFKPKEGSQWIHRCHVLKDRFDLINGQSFDKPDFESFKPHFLALNIGGDHKGVDTTRNSEARFDFQEKPEWKEKETRKKIILEEMGGLLDERYPSRTADDKKERALILKNVFHTHSKTAIENMPLDKLEAGFAAIKIIINPLMGADQNRTVHALFKSVMDIDNHDEVRMRCGDMIKKHFGVEELTSMTKITREQADKIIEELKKVEAEQTTK